MIDLLSAIMIWFFSILVSIMSIIQTKGKDWYSPITNKQKMIMTIINVFVFFLVVVFMHEAFFVDMKKSMMISLVVLLIIILFAGASIFKETISFLKNIRFSRITMGKCQEKKQDDVESNDFKIKEHIQKLLTVFNCTFFLLNVIIVFVVTKTQDVSSYRLVIIEHSQIVAFVTLFWLTLVGVVITSKDWSYGDVAKVTKDKKVKRDANYYIKKIVSRNR